MSTPRVLATFPKNTREFVRVALDHYRGHDLIDLRICVPLAEHASALTPTKTGVSLRVGLLPQLIEALRAAEVEARAQGVLE